MALMPLLRMPSLLMRGAMTCAGAMCSDVCVVTATHARLTYAVAGRRNMRHETLTIKQRDALDRPTSEACEQASFDARMTLADRTRPAAYDEPFATGLTHLWDALEEARPGIMQDAGIPRPIAPWAKRCIDRTLPPAVMTAWTVATS